MRTINVVCLANGVSVSTDILGRAGEQNAVQLSIDASAVLQLAGVSGALTATLYYMLPNGVALSGDSDITDSSLVLVTIPAFAMQVAGAVKVQLKLSQGSGESEIVLKTYMWEMHVDKSISATSDTPPDPVRTWLDEVDDKLEAALEFEAAINQVNVNVAQLAPDATPTGEGEINQETGLTLTLGIPRGQKGDPGTGLQVKGKYDNVESLQAGVQSPIPGDTYAVGTADPYDIYIYNIPGGWTNYGKIQGAQGEPGKPGEPGAKGDTGATGPAGPNEVSATTTTAFNGLLKGNGSTVQQAAAGVDYAGASHTHALSDLPITVSQTDLEAGTSALATNTLYIVYE